MNKVTSYRNEANGYADDADKADERGFTKLRYTINKLKSAFVRLIRVVRVPICFISVARNFIHFFF